MKKRVSIAVVALAAVGALVLLAFAAGVEIGHRRGYDEGWRECKYDAKETLLTTNCTKELFWHWHGHAPLVIRQHRGFFCN